MDDGVNLIVETTEAGYVVLADLPGFETSQLEVIYEDDLLRIRGIHDVGDDVYARPRHVHEPVSIPAEDEPIDGVHIDID